MYRVRFSKIGDLRGEQIYEFPTAQETAAFSMGLTYNIPKEEAYKTFHYFYVEIKSEPKWQLASNYPFSDLSL